MGPFDQLIIWTYREDGKMRAPGGSMLVMQVALEQAGWKQIHDHGDRVCFEKDRERTELAIIDSRNLA